jgi:hypothetical protein
LDQRFEVDKLVEQGSVFDRRFVGATWLAAESCLMDEAFGERRMFVWFVYINT